MSAVSNLIQILIVRILLNKSCWKGLANSTRLLRLNLHYNGTLTVTEVYNMVQLITVPGW
jgi:hypothetical protein